MNLLPRDRFLLWIAQGFWAGRVPVAPGTAGSLVGIVWMLLLAWPGNAVLYIVGILLSIPISVYTSARAEKLLGKTDPGSVVIDEIIALPIAGLALIFIPAPGNGGGSMFSFQMLSAGELLSHHALGLGMVFLLFRFFDVLKPWPIGVSQKLPGGWGITIDDILAAAYVNIVMAVWLAFLR